MQHLVVSEGSFPSDSILGFNESLFDTDAYRQHQSSDKWISFYARCVDEKVVKAAIHFYIDGQVAKSPLRAPFGSLSCADDFLAEDMMDLVCYVEERLGLLQVKSIVMKNPPVGYSPQQLAMWHVCLLNNGYKIGRAEIGSIISVTQHSFAQGLNRLEKRKLNKAHELGLKVKIVERGNFKEIYDFISACREEKNYPVSMTSDDLVKLVDKFPDHYFLFGAYAGRQLAAAAILVKVYDDILYDFYHDHDKAFDDVSPVVVLLNGIYSWCQQNAIKMVDLGTSAVDGKPNAGLIQFKRRLGGKETMKLSFEKEIR